MARKEKVDPVKDLTDKILSSIPSEELAHRHLKMFEIMNHELYIAPPQSVADSYKFGWMRGIALMTDTMISGKWHSWLSAIEAGDCNPDTMPLTAVEEHPAHNSLTKKMLEKCMSILTYTGLRVTDFIDWIGYGLGIAWFKKPRISDKIWEELYKTFNLDLFLMEPADHLSNFVSEYGQSGHLDYYPTPIHITSMINKMLNADRKRTDSQYEPCIGGAAMLLPSESLNLVGVDLSLTMVKVSSIQAFLYKPWMLYVPKPIIGVHADKATYTISKYFEFNTDTRIYWGDSLLGEHKVPAHIFKEDEPFVDIYCHPADLTKREVFQYEEDMFKDWNTLQDDLKEKIVKAQSREIGFDVVTTNPPFNAKLSSSAHSRLKELHDSNRLFLEKREERLAIYTTSSSIMNKIIEEVELKTASASKKIIEGQMEIVF